MVLCSYHLNFEKKIQQKVIDNFVFNLTFLNFLRTYILNLSWKWFVRWMPVCVMCYSIRLVQRLLLILGCVPVFQPNTVKGIVGGVRPVSVGFHGRISSHLIVRHISNLLTWQGIQWWLRKFECRTHDTPRAQGPRAVKQYETRSEGVRRFIAGSPAFRRGAARLPPLAPPVLSPSNFFFLPPNLVQQFPPPLNRWIDGRRGGGASIRLKLSARSRTAARRKAAPAAASWNALGKHLQAGKEGTEQGYCRVACLVVHHQHLHLRRADSSERFTW
jgi:hypothetical protein